MSRCRAPAVLLLSMLAILSGCASLSDSLFLVSHVEDPLKAGALTDQGVELYQLYLVNRGEYGRVNEVRRYFVVALRYDPENLRAQQYLQRIDDYRSDEVSKRLREAAQYLKKPKRTPDEDYALCLAAQRAYLLDPQNEQVVQVRRETTEIRVTLVDTYVQRARSAVAQIKEDTPGPTRERLYVDAFRSVNRALAIDPESRDANAEKRAMRSELNDIVAAHLHSAQQKIDRGLFTEAQKELPLLQELDRTLGGAFARQVEDLAYDLNYRWARTLLDRRDYAGAEGKAAAALAVRRTDEAAALKARAAQARASADAGGTFEAGLQRLDKLIGQGDWAGAWRTIGSLSKSATDRASQAALETRRERVRAQLPPMYEKAVQLYKAEEFQKAVELFEVILKIDVDYEQAAEYLEKARAKQKLIEQYGGDA